MYSVHVYSGAGGGGGNTIFSVRAVTSQHLLF